jgi:hypothetical protein
MPRRTSQRSISQSLVLVIALLLLLAVAAVVAVRGISHGATDQDGDAVGPILAELPAAPS